MKLSVGDSKALSFKWLVVDLDKRMTIPHVVSADDDSGEYEVAVGEPAERDPSLKAGGF